MCVTHSSRPLRLIELGSLVSSFTGLDDFKKGKDLVRASCGPLLEILEDQTVSVIHHSFTEFLRDGSRQQTLDSFPVLNSRYAHSMLAILSLQYLDRCPLLDTNTDSPGGSTYDDFDDLHHCEEEHSRRHQVLQDMNLTLPLLNYSVENLKYHLDNSDPEDIELLDTISTCLASEKPAFGLWMYHYWKSRLCSSFTPVHLAAFANMPLYVIEHLGPNDTKDGDGRTPLSYAAEKGTTKMVKFFLSHGADPKSDCRCGLTPLHYATQLEHVDIIQLLLEAGVSPLIPTTKPDPYNEYHFYDSSFGHTPLEDAFNGNSEAIIDCFMPFITPEYANRCLHLARGAKVIEAVLKTGQADVDYFASGYTRFFRATVAYDFETMKILLPHGADVNKRCSGGDYDNEGAISLIIDNPRGPMPIHAFAGYEQSFTRGSSDGDNAEKCLRLLLDNGADINATTDGENHKYRGRDGNFTPLFYAVKKNLRGYPFGVIDNTGEKLASILLKAGADPNAKSTCGCTPIHVANPECLPLFGLLVAHSADVNAKNESGRAPILELIQQYQAKPDIKVFEKLIECGADVNTSDDEGNNIFHVILGNLEKFKMTDLPFFQLMLRAGVDINKQNKKGKPPLFMYKLPEERWPRDRRNEDDEPLLRALVQVGLDMQAYNSQGETILSDLISRFHCSVKSVEKFVRLGADFTALNNDGSTLLHVAVKSKLSIDWIKFLSSKGVDPLAKDEKGRTPIHNAVEHYEADATGRAVVEYLIELGISPAAKDAFGSTVLHLASKRKRENGRHREDQCDWVDAILKTGILGAQNVNAPTAMISRNLLFEATG
ncbi:hypothetical protein V2G26_007295 [Clonostachys chloroleuca]